jgi:hypothetical protein
VLARPIGIFAACAPDLALAAWRQVDVRAAGLGSVRFAGILILLLQLMRRGHAPPLSRGRSSPRIDPFRRLSLAARPALESEPQRADILIDGGRPMQNAVYRHLLIATDGSELANKAGAQRLALAKHLVCALRRSRLRPVAALVSGTCVHRGGARGLTCWRGKPRTHPGCRRCRRNNERHGVRLFTSRTVFSGRYC